MTEEILKSIYYDASSPGSYGGVEKLYIEAKKLIPNLRRIQVLEWLQGQIVYTLHKQSRRKFKRNPVVCERINENFQADLVDMKDFSNGNDEHNCFNCY